MAFIEGKFYAVNSSSLLIKFINDNGYVLDDILYDSVAGLYHVSYFIGNIAGFIAAAVFFEFISYRTGFFSIGLTTLAYIAPYIIFVYRQ